MWRHYRAQVSYHHIHTGYSIFINELLICLFTFTEMKTLQHESCVKWGDEPTPRRKYQTVEHVKRIWWNSLKSENTKFISLRNSKPIVGMDLYHQHIFFMYNLFWFKTWFLIWRGIGESRATRTEHELMAQLLARYFCSTADKGIDNRARTVEYPSGPLS
jgi:hypothetical protein